MRTNGDGFVTISIHMLNQCFNNIREVFHSEELPFEGSAERNISFTSLKNPNVLHDHVASTCAFLHFHFQYIEVVRNVELTDKMFQRMSSLTTTILQFQHALRMQPFHLKSFLNGPKFKFLSVRMVKFAISFLH